MAIVINLKDAGTKNCICEGSKGWLHHWELRKNTTANFCRACSKEASLKPAFVRKASEMDTTIYIVPLCDICYDKDGEISIWSERELVRAECS